MNYFKLLLVGVFGLIGTYLSAQVTYNFTGSIDTYVVPAGVSSIQIEANGAAGGDGSAGTGGLGAQMIGTFAVTPGQVLDILVGEQPAGGNGGGGGTFVVDQATGTPLIVAGAGGGGAGSCCGVVHNGEPGVTTEDGTAGLNASGGTGAGGTGGNGGSVGTNGQCGGAGGGFLTDGDDGFGGSTGGAAYVNGGAAGTFEGGFGGGGGSHCAADGCAGGGGGGYSGGGATGGGGQWGGGGGGGSFNSGTDQANTDGVNSGHGTVIITELCDGLVTTVSSDTVCETEEIVLSAESTNGGTVTWDSGIENDVPFFAASTGTVTYTASSDSDDDCDFVIDIFVKEAPAFSLTTNDELVGGDGAVFMTLSSAIFPITYDWDNDGTGDFDDPQNLTGLTSGTYVVEVMHGNNCSRVDSATVGTQLSIEEDDLVLANVYPNPTEDELNITYPGSFNYSIINILGEVVLEGTANTKVQLSMKEFEAGTYTITITAEDNIDILKAIKY